MNNIGKIPSCSEHYTYKICLLDSMNLNKIKEWIEDPENTTKNRKQKREKKSGTNNRPEQNYQGSTGTWSRSNMCRSQLLQASLALPRRI